MLKISRLTDYGTQVMSGLSTRPNEFVKSAELALEIGVAAPTVAKLLKRLTREGLVESSRGQQGGYRLARLPANITVAEIIQALDGPLGLTDCSADEGSCDHESDCNVKVNWQKISRVVANALDQVTLEQLLQPQEQPLRFMPNLDLRGRGDLAVTAE
ncbi:MAG: SUF system Fe-S cluster assembly regulator [Immundisolibacteraceae bacterium]|nr:SUF system Fe-S cluster assembly regulator [Immundisolibacteraceae bacterium]